MKGCVIMIRNMSCFLLFIFIIISLLGAQRRIMKLFTEEKVRTGERPIRFLHHLKVKTMTLTGSSFMLVRRFRRIMSLLMK